MTEAACNVTGEYVLLDNETYYRIQNSHLMPSFFMSLVGASDHWMFVSSTGALTAGRCDADSALFPYAADDQISIAQSCTGPVTLIREQGVGVWEPFVPFEQASESIRRNLYKTPLGNKLAFEEINKTRNLAFRYRWVFSEKFGFVRSCRLENLSTEPRQLQLLDGLRNILPYGVASEFMMRFSNLANAYKKSERLDRSNLGLFYLSSIPTDRAEPSEGLKATVAWQTGLDPEATLLSTEQVELFRDGAMPKTETDVRGKAGAYLCCQTVELQPSEAIEWHLVAELAQDHSEIVHLDGWINDDATAALAKDIEASEEAFLRIASSSDALQAGSNQRRSNRHLSNTVFNVMRGGIPIDDYRINGEDFRKHVAKFNLATFEANRGLLDSLPQRIGLSELIEQLRTSGDEHLLRLGQEYLPLAFSRRHGDPTRPWNRFAIKLRSNDGQTNLNYQGNWRDIFQNWEALAISFPEFTSSMICSFVNSTTADGYNPYRVTKDGFEWEEPTPDDPWANIGYWGDHQIIYLLKLLEFNRRFDPGGLDSLLNASNFVHANIPYRIKDFSEIQQDPQDTIAFDSDSAKSIEERVSKLGADGKLLHNRDEQIHNVTLLEKFLTLSLAKLSNFIPDGGIWLNTQRPEWNDANNALVGNGLSMVTTCYLYRWFAFLEDWISKHDVEAFFVSSEVVEFFDAIYQTLSEGVETLGNEMDPLARGELVATLSQAGSDYRNQLYDNPPTGEKSELTRESCLAFFDTARRHLETTIRNNRREDGLYHAYNLLRWDGDDLHVEHLYEMLEGQVAVLSAGLLSADECTALLDALRNSKLYRANQDSYMLYPDRNLPRFLEKNQISTEAAFASSLLTQLLNDGNEDIVRRDDQGGIHFNGGFRNAADMRTALSNLPKRYKTQAENETQSLTELFVEVFGHRQFTGRSGTFFAYEGLGSIYWHMVSKLGLAVAENFFAAIDAGENQDTITSLAKHYRAVQRGIGAEKTPTEYGAFPSDPYSHTPENAGVKQPGMTGQVKEDILARFAELGAHVADGQLHFRLELFDRNELVDTPQEFSFFNIRGELEAVSIPKHGFAFTLCQVPITYRPGDTDSISVCHANGEQRTILGLKLDKETSQKLFSRSGEVTGIDCEFQRLKSA